MHVVGNNDEQPEPDTTIPGRAHCVAIFAKHWDTASGCESLRRLCCLDADGHLHEGINVQIECHAVAQRQIRMAGFHKVAHPSQPQVLACRAGLAGRCLYAAIASTMNAKQHIISYCAAHPSAPCSPAPFRTAVHQTKKPSLADEARTQAYLYQHARSNSTAPNMAEVYATFYDNDGSTYLVMEHADVVSSPSAAAITDAVAWLLTCPLPDEGLGGVGRIGPVGSGSMFLFLAYGPIEAPVPFVHTAALEEDINEDINVFPTSFFSFYLHRVRATTPHTQLDFPVHVSSKRRLLGAAATIVMQSGNSSFDIDEDGNHTWSNPSPCSSCGPDTNTSTALSMT
ncbi:hypothetical protein MSAN_02427100 [Mycena sanguinolenta]|uniref:Uncharacterized protein n=1 Tax=Mycena sanguinolenta TaxID=230812 RepID=A0A8H7CDJ5_9AGAR|nr:hypothetical protein MSAN_02427100 [Mycena sanguinolenta]